MHVSWSLHFQLPPQFVPGEPAFPEACNSFAATGQKQLSQRIFFEWKERHLFWWASTHKKNCAWWTAIWTAVSIFFFCYTLFCNKQFLGMQAVLGAGREPPGNSIHSIPFWVERKHETDAWRWHPQKMLQLKEGVWDDKSQTPLWQHSLVDFSVENSRHTVA